MNKGVPPGYKQKWDYKEKTLQDNWKHATIYQIKTRSKGNRVRKQGNFKVGTGIDWKWQGIGKVRKIGRNKYLHTIKYTKSPLGVKPKGQKWQKLSKRK